MSVSSAAVEPVSGISTTTYPNNKITRSVELQLNNCNQVLGLTELLSISCVETNERTSRPSYFSPTCSEKKTC